MTTDIFIDMFNRLEVTRNSSSTRYILLRYFLLRDNPDVRVHHEVHSREQSWLCKPAQPLDMKLDASYL